MGRVSLNLAVFVLASFVGAQTPIGWQGGFNTHQLATPTAWSYGWRSPVVAVAPQKQSYVTTKKLATKQTTQYKPLPAFDIPYAPGVREAMLTKKNQAPTVVVKYPVNTGKTTGQKVVKTVKKKVVRGKTKKVTPASVDLKKDNRYRKVALKNKGSFKKVGNQQQISVWHQPQWQHVRQQPVLAYPHQYQFTIRQGYPQVPASGQEQPPQPGPESPPWTYPLQPDNQPGYPQPQPQPGNPQPQPQPGYPQPETDNGEVPTEEGEVGEEGQSPEDAGQEPILPEDMGPVDGGDNGGQEAEGEGGASPGDEGVSNGQNELGEGGSEASSNPNCKKPRGQFASQTACNRFVNCWDDVAVEQECGGSLLFNEELGYCDFPQNVDCGNRVIEKPAPIDESGQCPTPYGTYRSSTNCGAFIVCVDSVPNTFVCPSGLAYNDNLGVCDYDYRVDCGGIPLVPAPEEPETSEGGDEDSSSSSTGDQDSGSQSEQGGQGEGGDQPTGEEGVSEEGAPQQGGVPEGGSPTGEPQPGNPPSGGLPPAGYPRFPQSCVHGYIMKMTRDCRTVAACVHGQTRILNCPAGYGFDTPSGQCLHYTRARCG